jgi:hypothetical protein
MCSNDEFIAQKVYFSRLVRVCVGLTMLAASYWPAGFGRFLQVSALSSHWLADCANFRAIQAASQSTFVNEQKCSICD